MNLISRERAQQAILEKAPATFTAPELALLDQAIAAASQTIENWCRRAFAVQRYDERTQGHEGTPYLFLSQAPILAVERVTADPTVVLEITNTTATNQRASVQVTDTGLTLARVVSGTLTLDTSVTWSSNATLSAVAAAVNSLGNGWSARVPRSAYALWPSADLRPIQGALFCALGAWAGIKQHVTDLPSYEIEEEAAVLYRTDAPWPTSPGSVRVCYTAGYPEIPAPVQEATAEYAAVLFWQAWRDPGAASINVVGAGMSTYSLRNVLLPGACKGLLLPYRRTLV
jgi:hypothetical protein